MSPGLGTSEDMCMFSNLPQNASYVRLLNKSIADEFSQGLPGTALEIKVTNGCV